MNAKRHAYYPWNGQLSEEAQKILQELTGIQAKFKVGRSPLYLDLEEGYTCILPHEPLLHQVYLQIGKKMGVFEDRAYLDDFYYVLVNDDEIYDVSEISRFLSIQRGERHPSHTPA